MNYIATRKAIATTLAMCVAVAIASSAQAFMMSLGGPDQLMGTGGVHSNDGADALYALDHFGREIKIAEVGVSGPDNVVMQDLGVPSVGDDGNVWFGAAVLERHVLRWRIFSANPDAPLSDPVTLVIPSAPDADGIPVMRVDPRPVPGADGSVIFSTEVSGGGDAVFRISGGKLSRILRTGARLPDGRVIRKIIFGTVQVAAQGQVALSAYLAPGGQAELLVSDSGTINVIAAEGADAPDGTHYRAAFGQPAATPGGRGAIVAFTAHTDHGDSVFLYNRGTTRRILSTGARCRRGSVNYLSTERPALSPDGTVAVLASCSGTPVIFMVDDSGVHTIVRAQQQADYPGQFSQLGDPRFSRPGTIVFGAVGSDDIDRLFAISHAGRMWRVAPRSFERFDRPVMNAASEISHTISAATVTVNQSGKIAYLGGR